MLIESYLGVMYAVPMRHSCALPAVQAPALTLSNDVSLSCPRPSSVVLGRLITSISGDTANPARKASAYGVRVDAEQKSNTNRQQQRC